MISRLHPSFRRDFARLPPRIQRRTRKAYAQFVTDPSYSGLEFKRLGTRHPLWSVRITDSYRAVGVVNWIGSHGSSSVRTPNTTSCCRDTDDESFPIRRDRRSTQAADLDDDLSRRRRIRCNSLLATTGPRSEQRHDEQAPHGRKHCHDAANGEDLGSSEKRVHVNRRTVWHPLQFEEQPLHRRNQEDESPENYAGGRWRRRSPVVERPGALILHTGDIVFGGQDMDGILPP